MSVGIVGMSILSTGGSDSDDLLNSLKSNCNIKPVVYGKEGEEKCFGYASLLQEDARNGFDPDFFGMHPAQVCCASRSSECVSESRTNLRTGRLTLTVCCRQSILIRRRDGSSKAYGTHYLTPAHWMLVRCLTKK